MDTIEERLRVLERRVKRIQVVFLSGLILLMVVVGAGVSSAVNGAQSNRNNVLRLRGLVI